MFVDFSAAFGLKSIRIDKKTEAAKCKITQILKWSSLFPIMPT